MNYKDLYRQYGKIKIKCEGKDSLPLEFIISFQNDLKKRSKSNKKKLATLMFKQGFIAPFFIWKNKEIYKCLDGHGRLDVLCDIRDSGIPIPEIFPVVYIQADNEADAKEKLLAISSQYGEWNKLELETWLEGVDDEIKDTLRFVDKEIEADFDIPEIEEKAKNKIIHIKRCPECGYEW